MKKIIRLTESDLVRLVKKVIKEQVQQTGSTTPNTDQSFEELKKSLAGKKIQLYTDTTQLQWPKGLTNKEVPLFTVEITNLSENTDNKGIDFVVKDMRRIDNYGNSTNDTFDTETKDIYLNTVNLLTMKCGSNGEFGYGRREGGKIQQLPFSNRLHGNVGEEYDQNVYVMSKNLATELNKSNFCKSKLVDKTPDMQP
jgi:hypothetical protein